jgi:anti-sigma factor RsiW
MGSEDDMFGNKRSRNECEFIESKLVEYLDGRAQPAERHAVEDHLAGCASCRTRVAEFRSVWSALDDVQEISPSAFFDALLRQRIAAEPARRSFWHWIPSPRLAFAVTALVATSVWLSSMPRVTTNTQEASPFAQVAAESDFGMIRDLPVLENYDVVSKFDALSELPASPVASTDEVNKETR